MKKKTIFKIVGGALAGIILISAIVGIVYYKTKVAPVLSIMRNGYPAIYSDSKFDMYYCEKEIEEGTVIAKIIIDKYGRNSEASTQATVNAALAPKQTATSDTLDSWNLIFTFYTSIESIEPGYYVINIKDSATIGVLYLQYDKQLVKLYGKTMKAADLNKSWTQEFSIQ